MRLYAYRDRFGDERFGVLVADKLLTGAQLERRGRLTIDTHLGLGEMLRFEPDWQRRLAKATKRAIAGGAPLIDVDQRRPSAAIGAGDLTEKIVCIGLNYADHVAEGGRAAAERPMMFAKFANALVGDGDPVIAHPGTHALDLEVELGVVIGRRARRVPIERAMECVAGYVVANDISARDWQGNPQALAQGQKGDGQWLRAKGSDTFLPVGPTMVTPDELDPAAGARLRSWRMPASGPDAGTEVLMQDGSTANMIHGVPALIAMVSEQITLEPGDLVITGTPAGVGVFRNPPVFLVPGDVIRCEIEGIGSVANPIVDWTEDPRFEA